MAKKKRTRRRRGKARGKKQKQKIGIIGHGIGIGVPRLMNVLGAGTYYNPMAYWGSDWGAFGRAWAANETMSWTGFDPLTSEFRPERMVPNYVTLFGAHFASKWLNKHKRLPFKGFKW